MHLTEKMKKLINYNVFSALKIYIEKYFGALYKTVDCDHARYGTKNERYHLCTVDYIFNTDLDRRIRQEIMLTSSNNIDSFGSKIGQILKPELYVTVRHPITDVRTIITQTYSFVKSFYTSFIYNNIIADTFDHNEDEVKYYKIMTDYTLQNTNMSKLAINNSIIDETERRYESIPWLNIKLNEYYQQAYASIILKYNVKKNHTVNIIVNIFPFLKKVTAFMVSAVKTYNPNLKIYNATFENEQDIAHKTIKLTNIICKKICKDNDNPNLYNIGKKNITIADNIVFGNLTRNLVVDIKHDGIYNAFTIFNDKNKSLMWINTANTFKSLLISGNNRINECFVGGVKTTIDIAIRRNTNSIQVIKNAIRNDINTTLYNSHQLKLIGRCIKELNNDNNFKMVCKSKTDEVVNRYFKDKNLRLTLLVTDHGSRLPIITRNKVVLHFSAILKGLRRKYFRNNIWNLCIKIYRSDPTNYTIEVEPRQSYYYSQYITFLHEYPFLSYEQFYDYNKEIAEIVLDYINNHYKYKFDEAINNFVNYYLCICNKVEDMSLATLDNAKEDYKKTLNQINKHNLIKMTNNIRMGQSYDFTAFMVMFNYYLESNINIREV